MQGRGISVIEVKDRVPTQPNRRKITYSDGRVEYVTIEYADNPTEQGTPINKVLFDSIHSDILDHDHDASDIISGILPIIRGGTGASDAEGAIANLGLQAFVENVANSLGFGKVQSGMATRVNDTDIKITCGFKPKFYIVSTKYNSSSSFDEYEFGIIGGENAAISFRRQQFDTSNYVYFGIHEVYCDENSATIYGYSSGSRNSYGLEARAGHVDFVSDISIETGTFFAIG